MRGKAKMTCKGLTFPAHDLNAIKNRSITIFRWARKYIANVHPKIRKGKNFIISARSSQRGLCGLSNGWTKEITRPYGMLTKGPKNIGGKTSPLKNLHLKHQTYENKNLNYRNGIIFFCLPCHVPRNKPLMTTPNFISLVKTLIESGSRPRTLSRRKVLEKRKKKIWKGQRVVQAIKSRAPKLDGTINA